MKTLSALFSSLETATALGGFNPGWSFRLSRIVLVSRDGGTVCARIASVTTYSSNSIFMMSAGLFGTIGGRRLSPSCSLSYGSVSASV